MKYYVIEPEVAGGLGGSTVMNRAVHPPDVFFLHYQFDGWLGDVLVESFPCFIATAEAVKSLQSIGPTGLELAEVRVTKSSQFAEVHPD
jgi:hypothetical protein